MSDNEMLAEENFESIIEDPAHSFAMDMDMDIDFHMFCLDQLEEEHQMKETQIIPLEEFEENVLIQVSSWGDCMSSPSLRYLTWEQETNGLAAEASDPETEVPISKITTEIESSHEWLDVDGDKSER